MSYNIHPIFVHFPIALLFLYSIIKVIPFKKWFPQISLINIERFLLTVGLLGACAALFTGDTAEHLAHPDRQLVEMHSTFANIATFLYAALFLGELAGLLNSYASKLSSSWKGVLAISQYVELILRNKAFSIILAILAFVAIVVTGLLGGAMVYGVTADPIAPIVLNLLGISI